MKCSVITPVHNHWHLIPTLLDCLARQTLPQNQFEVILIENGSDDFKPPDKLPANVTIRTCTTPGSYAARNHGLAHANAPWLAFTDADCRPSPAWLENLLPRTPEKTDQPISQQVRAGKVQMTPSTRSPNRWEIYDLVKGIPQQWYVSRGYAATANLAVPASLARALNGFDSSRYSGGDAEFCRRAVAAGAKLEYLSEAIVEHPARTSWQELATKARRIKGGQLTRGSRRERRIWRIRTFLPPLIAIWRFLRTTEWPLGYRLTAVTVQFRLWLTEMKEAITLGATEPQR